MLPNNIDGKEQDCGTTVVERFPPEMYRAFFDDTRTIGGITLHTPTLSHVVVLNRLGCFGRIDADKAIISAFVLSHKSEDLNRVAGDIDMRDMERWLTEFMPDGESLAPVIEDMLGLAFRAGVFESKNSSANIMPSGYGWPLEVAERVCAEYGWKFDYVKHVPISTLFALLACIGKRNKSEKGPDYYARMFLPDIVAGERGA